MLLAQLRRIEVLPWSLTLKDQLGLGHVELSRKYECSPVQPSGGHRTAIADYRAQAVGGVQLVLRLGTFHHQYPVLRVHARVSGWNGACIRGIPGLRAMRSRMEHCA